MTRLTLVSAAVVAMLALASTAKAGVFDEAIIDEDYQQAELALQKKNEETCRKKSVRKGLSCFKDLQKEFKASGKRRGSTEYCKIHYLPMETKALKRKLPELATLKKKARHSPDNRQPGEVTADDFDQEMQCIFQIFEKRGVRY
ncbi:hypothetical protein [Pelagibius sp. Alg239-R121]|uniref:hypothetical protein n=1 Tax=Pelagibius sp. Alg239-R121 TaxID=2993448 RepID=UPI0024A61065|nr:hypothetical protein [Pelagibius sp. Alg239-R121]